MEKEFKSNDVLVFRNDYESSKYELVGRFETSKQDDGNYCYKEYTINEKEADRLNKVFQGEYNEIIVIFTKQGFRMC